MIIWLRWLKTIHAITLLFEGDILLARNVEDARKVNENGSRGAVIIGKPGFRWPKGEVYYTVNDPSLEVTVQQAIDHWMANTPIKFLKRTDQVDFISFEKLEGCFSHVGRQGGMQELSIGNGCSLGSAIHEIGHALGLWHEHTRNDRDQFVQIDMANVQPNQRHNFNKHILDGQDVGPFDFASIMMYSPFSFAVDKSKPTIRTLGGQPIGQRNGLSKGDIKAIRMIYPTLDWSKFPDLI